MKVHIASQVNACISLESHSEMYHQDLFVLVFILVFVLSSSLSFSLSLNPSIARATFLLSR